MAVDWRDEGIVLGCRPLGDTGRVLTAFTREHGRHAGLVRGSGRVAIGRATLEPGVRVDLHWRARLDDQLGTYSVEPADTTTAALLADRDRLAGLAALCALADTVLPDREPLPQLYAATTAVLGAMVHGLPWPALYVRWEVILLSSLGFGLDLAVCAATGRNDGLVYVSPRTGRAVSAAAGAPYHDRLLALPPFLAPDTASDPDPPPADLVAGLRLTGHFLEDHVLGPTRRRLPAARARLAERLVDRPGR